jgi:LacI family transcriptional regulator
VLGGSPSEVYAARERLAGIKEALAAARTAIAGVLECPWWPQPAHDALAPVLAHRPAPQALICLNDRAAFGAYQAAYEAGLRIPDELSIVSFDDSDLAGWLRPGLTSIALPHYELGRRAVGLLLAADRGTRTVLVPMPVRERESVARPADRTATRR